MALIKKDNVDKFKKKLDPFEESLDIDFSSLYTIVMNIASRTIGYDLVPVQPMKPPHAFDI